MKIFWKVIRFIFGAFMIYGGVSHFLNPVFYEPFVPAFLPFTTGIIYLSGVAEIVLGLMLFVPKYTHWGATGLLLLMLAFLPIHVWDVFSENPAIGSSQAALIRLPVQFLFIFIAWKLRE